MKPTPEDIRIRTAYKPGDIGYITYMHGLLYDFGPFFEVYVADSLAAFYKNMDSSRERVWIAEHDDRIIGSIALKDTDNAAQLRYFLIHPDYRGIGLGNRMMELFTAFMKHCEYTSSFLLTEKQLEVAAKLYTKYGYHYVSSQETDFGLVEMRYELKL